MKPMPRSLRVVALVLLAALGMMCSHSPTAPSATSAVLVSPGVMASDTVATPDPPSTTSIRFSLSSCRNSTSTTWSGCDGTATINMQKPVTSGYVAVTLNYGCATEYNCPSNYHGELRVSSATPGSIVVPITSTSLPKDKCTSPMTTVVHVFDARDGRGDPGNELYFEGVVLTLNCGTSAPTPTSASNASFNGTWSGTFSGEAVGSGVLQFEVSDGRITMEAPDAGTGTLSLSTIYATSTFFTRTPTNSCTWTGPFIPGGARQSSASGIWSCSNGSSGQWDANRISTATPNSPAPTTGTNPTTPTTGTTPSTGSITILSTTSITCTEAGVGHNCRTGTITLRNDSSALAGLSVRIHTNPSNIFAPVFRMPAVGGTISTTLNSTPSTFACPPTQTSVSLILADSSANSGDVLAVKSVSMSVSCP